MYIFDTIKILIFVFPCYSHQVVYYIMELENDICVMLGEEWCIKSVVITISSF
jgi:hypothetical protein